MKSDLQISNRKRSQSGYTLIAVMMVSLVTALAMATATDVLRGGVKSISSTTHRAEDYIEAENAYAQAVQWLRDNSRSMTSVFGSSQFSRVFTRGGTSVGCNDTQDMQLPTRVKLASAPCNSVILVSDPTLLRNPLGATSSGSFPPTVNLANGEPFFAQASLRATNFGSKKVRITLIDAVPKGAANTSTSSGSSSSPTSGTCGGSTTTEASSTTQSSLENDYRPLYRIDVFDREEIVATDDGNPLLASPQRTYQREKGTHLFGYVSGEPEYNYGAGFVGWSYASVVSSCDSYRSKDGPYSPTSAAAKCQLSSAGGVRLGNESKVYGSLFYVSSLGSYTFDKQVCGDMLCKTPGRITQALSSREGPRRPTFEPWNSYCPSNQGSATVAAGRSVTLTVSGDKPNQKCWTKLTVPAAATVTLTSTEYPYFFDQIDLSGGGRLVIAPKDPNGVVTVYTRFFTGPISGSQIINSVNRPFQFQINYLGVNQVNIWGSTPFQAFITAPLATLILSGSVDYRGGIQASLLVALNTSGLHYDTSNATPILDGMSYRLRDITQVYKQ